MHQTNVIIDGSNMIFRAFFISNNDNSPEFNPRVLYMFLNMIKKQFSDHNGNNLYIAWDKKLIYPSTNFRKELIDYKDGRDSKTASHIMKYADICRIITDALGIKSINPGVLEADDVIAWLVSVLEGYNIIVSSDNDMAQLVTNTTGFYHPFKNIMITPDNFESVYNVPLANYVLFKSILGDKSDNIQGIPGYGKVKAARMAVNFDSSVFNESDMSNINRNKMIIDLGYGIVNTPNEIDIYKKQLDENISLNIDKFKKICLRYKFAGILSNMREWLLMGQKETPLL